MRQGPSDMNFPYGHPFSPAEQRVIELALWHALQTVVRVCTFEPNEAEEKTITAELVAELNGISKPIHPRSKASRKEHTKLLSVELK